MANWQILNHEPGLEKLFDAGETQIGDPPPTEPDLRLREFDPHVIFEVVAFEDPADVPGPQSCRQAF